MVELPITTHVFYAHICYVCVIHLLKYWAYRLTAVGLLLYCSYQK